MNRIKKGDTVEVIAGDDRDMRGEVMRVMPKDEPCCGFWGEYGDKTPKCTTRWTLPNAGWSDSV